MTTNQTLIAMNPVPNTNQREIVNGNLMGNLSLTNPTIEELNAAICGGQAPTEAETVEPAFGVHAREAVGALRRVFR